MGMGLKRYWKKRDFEKTPEPSGKRRVRARVNKLRYCIQKHDATRLHYDFRLELDGVLLSWAVPKGPSLDPAVRRLAVHVEDHPIEYGKFEGLIPKGQYGGGTVLLWDRGTWEPVGDARAGMKKGHLKFRLHGDKLHGTWALVRMDEKNWLLIKDKDDEALRGSAAAITELRPESVATGRSIEDIEKRARKTWRGKAA